MAEMTKEAIEKSLKEHDGYKQPLLNDQLYLHCKGFLRIGEVIGEYLNVKALWLQQNALSKIENLEKLQNVGCLYLHQNCITSMKGLEQLVNLHTLNLSQNYITKIEGLEHLPHLETLLISHNRISDVSGLENLRCGSDKLSCLDISHNGLRCDEEKGETPQDVIDLLATLPSLACLYIQGNEISNQTRYFRRKVVGSIKQLTFMDERPVFPEDRRATDAWMIGGFEAEEAERDAIREEKKAAEKASLAKYKAMQEAAKQIREEREEELRKYEEAKKIWTEEMKAKHEVERRNLINDQEDALTDITRDYKAACKTLEEDMASSHAAATKAAATATRHLDPYQQRRQVSRRGPPSEKQAAIWQRYAAWEMRRK
eukprot:TRINITY_DN21414_c0_g1_i1.p1 TRINITY_DN21414_c0_g1~~TRINITY_DN21414_c0_g1_i1.p1  ORF type:complete len:372 (+),score=102.73 TRINITY_DN21414_c0_g1_i1:147-1262(+)